MQFPGRFFGSDDGDEVRRVLVLLLFAAVVLIGTLGFDFVFDDNLVVLDDPLLTGRLDLGAVFGREVRVGDVSLGYYRPLITLLYAADHVLWGENPAGYHLTNLLLHLGVTYLLYRAACRTTGRVAGAWTAGLLFALLPIHAEAIGWIQGRVDLAATLLALLAFLALLRAREVGGGRSRVWAALGGLTFFTALLAKESAAPLPLAWLVWELSVPQDRGPTRWSGLASRFVPLLLGGLGYALLRHWALGPLVSIPLDLSSPGLRLVAFLAALREYARVLFLSDLTLNFHRHLPLEPMGTTVLLGTLIAFAIVGGLGLTWRRARHLFPWVAWIPIMLSPALLFLLYARAPQVGFFTAERFLYLPSAGWCVLLGALLDPTQNDSEGPARTWWRPVTAGCIALGYAGLLIIRLLPWADPVEFYAAMQAQPDVPPSVRVLIHNNLGKVYLDRDLYLPAQAEFQAALRLVPRHVSAHNNLGVLLIREGKPAEARRWLETAIRLNPLHAEAYGNLGAAFEAEGNLPAARQAYEAGLRAAPRSAWLIRGLDRVQSANDQSRTTRPPRISP